VERSATPGTVSPKSSARGAGGRIGGLEINVLWMMTELAPVATAARSAGYQIIRGRPDPGARAPGFMLSPARQACM